MCAFAKEPANFDKLAKNPFLYTILVVIVWVREKTAFHQV